MCMDHAVLHCIIIIIKKVKDKRSIPLPIVIKHAHDDDDDDHYIYNLCDTQTKVLQFDLNKLVITVWA